MAKVLRRSVDQNGKLIGKLDGSMKCLVYDVEFSDGAIKKYTANVIAENVLAQVDSSGYYSQLLAGIGNHQKMENAIEKENAFITTRRGVRRPRQTTVGWKFLCNWRDGTSSWTSLKS